MKKQLMPFSVLSNKNFLKRSMEKKSMIDYLVVYVLGFATPYILKFIIVPRFAKTETWNKIKAYMDKLEKKK